MTDTHNTDDDDLIDSFLQDDEGGVSSEDQEGLHDDADLDRLNEATPAPAPPGSAFNAMESAAGYGNDDEEFDLLNSLNEADLNHEQPGIRPEDLAAAEASAASLDDSMLGDTPPHEMPPLGEEEGNEGATIEAEEASAASVSEEEPEAASSPDSKAKITAIVAGITAALGAGLKNLMSSKKAAGGDGGDGVPPGGDPPSSDDGANEPEKKKPKASGKVAAAALLVAGAAVVLMFGLPRGGPPKPEIDLTETRVELPDNLGLDFDSVSSMDDEEPIRLDDELDDGLSDREPDVLDQPLNISMPDRPYRDTPGLELRDEPAPAPEESEPRGVEPAPTETASNTSDAEPSGAEEEQIAAAESAPTPASAKPSAPAKPKPAPRPKPRPQPRTVQTVEPEVEERPDVEFLAVMRPRGCSTCSETAVLARNGQTSVVAHGDSWQGYRVSLAGDRMTLSNSKGSWSYLPEE